MRKKGRNLSLAHETNLFNAAILPFKLCTSLTIFDGASSIIVRTFSGLTSIPLWDTINPKNFPVVTPNVHLLGFNFILYVRSVSKVSRRSSRWSSFHMLFTSMSST